MEIDFEGCFQYNEMVQYKFPDKMGTNTDEVRWMLKVFLTEDESVVREGLRDMIPWEQYGFEFVGEASDGEMALPLVRKVKPDILITDIKMPFMDGLAFSRLVSKELPNTRIIILSGYDDFNYAQQAIGLNVDQYLLKPISRASMIKALEQTKARIEEEREQQDYRRRFIRESREYEHYARRVFFEKLVSGTLTVSEIYEQAAALELELDAEAYNIELFVLQPHESGTAYSEQIAVLQDDLLQDFLLYPDFLVFRASVLSYAVLIKGSRDRMSALTERCIALIRQRCAEFETALDWYCSIGTATQRLSGLPQCYTAASHALAYRHLMPGVHVFRPDLVEQGSESGARSAVDLGNLDPMLLRGFVQNGLDSEIEDFTAEFFSKLGSAQDSLMVRHYLLLSARINALAAIEELGLDRASLAEELPVPELDAASDLRAYFREVLRTAISLRDEESLRRGGGLVDSALEYIDQHFADESISLNAVAQAINVSTNYLSAVFSQKMGLSFVEYLTQKRMTRAKQLLRQSGRRTGEVAAEVGYRDPRYFSFVFKKTQGCTPREYRAGEADR